MELQLPYRAEYAKTGRASCKKCKSNIGQSSLRIAIMVQSGFHDGKQPNWFHFSCFFQKHHPKSVGDIDGFENLKYEDQKSIKEKMDVSMDIVAEPKGKKGKKRTTGNDLLNDFGIEYAASSRAVCRGCEIKIMKGEVRVKKVVYDTEVGMKFGGQPLWHHVECFEKVRDEFGYFAGGDDLPGFAKLKKEDKEIVKNAIKPKANVVSDAKKIKMEHKNETEVKHELEEDKLMIKQSKKFHSHKDNLRMLKKSELSQLLVHNRQEVPEGFDAIIEAAADMLTWGRLEPCDKCCGQYKLGKNNYICTGNVSEWAKCLQTKTDPPRIKVSVPEELKNKHDFLSNYKSAVSNRIFQYAPPTTSSYLIKKEEGEASGPRVERDKPKLYDYELVILGNTKKSKESLTTTIVKLGGAVKTKIHSGTFAVVSTEEEVEKMSKRMQDVKEHGIHVVKEDFLKKVVDATDVIALLNKENICDWQTDPSLRIVPTEKMPRKSIYTKSASASKVTLKLKAGGAVDPESGLDDVAHIYTDSNGLKYNVVLALTDIQSGKNSYYKMQLLKSDNGSRFWLFRGWGRIGTSIGGKTVNEGSSLPSVIAEFNALFKEKTGNKFNTPYAKVPGRYVPIDVDYGDEARKLEDDASAPSTLAKPIQDLIKLIFDVDMMKKTMLEFELDTEKMPLGKLSRTQLTAAYTVLNNLSEVIARDASQHDLIALTNHFYTLVPHSFGVDQPPIIHTEEVIRNKIEMIESLMEIELAYSMLTDKTANNEKNPIDAHYHQLNTVMEVLDKTKEEFKLLKKYVQNTHAATHSMYELVIEDIFKIKRANEDKRYKPFKKLHNRKLLWHGSRLTNWVGILSHGLKIAPPEAPVTGYMFGKGIYFADMVSKSANYCFTSKQSNTGLLMLCETALGDMYECTQATPVTTLPNKKHSTKGIGKTFPNPKDSHIRKDGVEIPLGEPIETNKVTSLLYNEFIVYDIAQVNCQYLLKMKFKYNY